jgi:hypothetical protein
MTIQKVLNNLADSLSQYLTQATQTVEKYGHTFKNLDKDEKLTVIAKTVAAAGAAGILGAAFCPALTGLFMVGGAGFAFKHSIDSCSFKGKAIGLYSHLKNNPKGVVNSLYNKISNHASELSKKIFRAF